MPGQSAPCTVGMVLAELGPAARLLAGGESAMSRSITRADVWFAGMPLPVVRDALVVCPSRDPTQVNEMLALLSEAESRMAAIPFGEDIDSLLDILRIADHVVIGLSAEVNVADVVAVVARATRPAEEEIARRLSVLQRTLSQALTDPPPLPALLSRLKRTCNATVALLDVDGRVVHATGPLPLALLHTALSKADRPSVLLEIDGWRGIAQQVADTLDEGRSFGWLVVATRRAPFPDPFVRAAVEIAGSLVETAHRIAVAERTQDRAIRASVLEQLLALRVTRDDPELFGRAAGLGIRFDDELRVLVVRPARVVAADRQRVAIAELGLRLGQIFRSASIGEFLAVRDDHVSVLAQCSPATARRLLVANDASHDVQVGAGRRVADVGDVVDSYNDAHLALRALQRFPDRSGFVAFEDFDFATRLFSNVGLDRMVESAQEFFRPLEGREPLIAAVKKYFAHAQNIKAAANDLFVHHNSLRYRLAKAEELLGISFTDPAAISSTYLALTALDLVDDQSASPRFEPARRAGAAAVARDLDSIDSVGEHRRPDDVEFGVVHGPER